MASSKSIVFTTIFLLCSLPFGVIEVVNLFGVSIKYQMLSHIIILMLLISTAFRLRYNKIDLLIFGIFCGYVFIHLILADNAIQALKHLSIYSAFLLALFFQSIRLNVNPENAIKQICLALTIGLLVAIVINVFFKNVVVNALSSDGYLPESTYYRLYWSGSLVAMMAILLSVQYRIKHWRIYSAFFLVGILLTMNRTTFVVLGLILLYLFLKPNVLDVPRKNVAMGFIFIIFIASLILYSGSSIGNILNERIFADNAYEVAFEYSRFGLYENYYQTLSEGFNYAFGNGLGVPLATFDSKSDAYYADISAITFIIPMGLLGLLAMVTFIYRLFKKFHYISDFRSRYLMSIFGLSAVFLSFNIDIYARSDFIIVLTMLASIYRSSRLGAINAAE